jgi:hypothetical protein
MAEQYMATYWVAVWRAHYIVPYCPLPCCTLEFSAEEYDIQFNVSAPYNYKYRFAAPIHYVLSSALGQLSQKPYFMPHTPGPLSMI